jgi:hypothetical protein
MPDYDLDDAGLLARCRVERMRSSGPGGQHCNRTESAARLTHISSGVQAQCQDHRNHARNQADALIRLRIRLACRLRGGADVAWLHAHRQGRRLALGPRASDFPRVLAVCLDALAKAEGQLALAAEGLGLSTSQLARFLHDDSDALQAANAIRAAHGLGSLHA